MNNTNEYYNHQNAPTKRKIKYLNVALCIVALYFMFNVARQQIKLAEINKEIEQLESQFSNLIKEEYLLKQEIENAKSDHYIKTKVKDVLGWIEEGDYKVLEQK